MCITHLGITARVWGCRQEWQKGSGEFDVICALGSTIRRLFPCGIRSDASSKKPQQRGENKRQELVSRIKGCLSFGAGGKKKKR